MAANIATEMLLNQVTDYIMNVSMYPVFFSAHFILGCLIVREDSKDLGSKFRQNHPFAMWFCSVIAGLSGVFVANFLFGNPLVDILKEHHLILLVSLLWYLINYSPYDVVYKIVMFKPVKVIAAVLQEFLRVRFIYLGFHQAAKVYPGAYIIMLLGGAIKGNGYGFIRIVERLIRGKWTPTTNEILDVSYFAKSGMYASFTFLLHHLQVIPLQIQYLYCSIVAIFVCLRLVILFRGVTDPLLSIEKPVCAFLFGSDTGNKLNVATPEMKDKKIK
ncbi:trimeric intracellular cation channel type 1B.2-like [Physella acuta]|uniref:trimeric intracellular cation channel type 1B.2-like n=1 Tax=Physella acuta TaxID=109671 RepID=UPI0027DE7CD5|nr:trimeric intracellular cation channel type 1B.2-like [Physella acuta]XP_059159091.1 trimeric intracellular cation channel type 1B.2-like [Physella acuta]XP_059159093.1 trimeric intracellular cation channel type 1B.2-like [Physella acuta]